PGGGADPLLCGGPDCRRSSRAGGAALQCGAGAAGAAADPGQLQSAGALLARPGAERAAAAGPGPGGGAGAGERAAPAGGAARASDPRAEPPGLDPGAGPRDRRGRHGELIAPSLITAPPDTPRRRSFARWDTERA